jgi:hypothetical protein
MNERLTILLTAIAGLTLGVAGFVALSSVPDTPGLFGNSSAAFRDGLYQARLQAEQGKKPHVASGRWAARADRIAFVAGYQEGCRIFAKAHPETQTRATSIELAGLRDGIEDGLRDRAALQPFQVQRAIQSRHAALQQIDVISNDLQNDPRYQLAYVNGYQQGYYARIDAAEFQDRT